MKKDLLSQGDFNLKRWVRQRPGDSNVKSPRPRPLQQMSSKLKTATEAHLRTGASRPPCRRRTPALAKGSGSESCAGSYCIREADPAGHLPGCFLQQTGAGLLL